MPGEVIIQTYNPNSFPIEDAKIGNYDLFYQTEIKLRKQLKYPPFCDIIVFSFSGEKENQVIDMSSTIYKMLVNGLPKYNVQVFSPNPSPIDKIQNKYRWRIIAKGIVNEEITIVINKILKNVYDKNNWKKINIFVDVNPNNMM